MPAASENPAGLPLRDITIVAIEQAVAMSFATRQLADLGARVIKIERPDGGDQLIAVLDGAAIANARVNSVADFLHHPQLVARNRWSAVGTPTGTARALAPPVIYHHSAPPPDGGGAGAGRAHRRRAHRAGTRPGGDRRPAPAGCGVTGRGYAGGSAPEH